LLTATKAFCGCSNQFGDAPNSNVCPVCLGLPGTLPVLNRELVEYIIRMGLATGCRITPRSILARKNYFYPDLPKGYQISQYEEPICVDGSLEVELEGGAKTSVRIKRIHMEEDAGKLIHDQGPQTLVDLNRCGTPLIEIVTEPDLRSPREAYHALILIRQLVTYLGICDGTMEEGSLRCDANVSIRLRGETGLGTKTEVKNMNSFRNVERALEFEIQRQTDLVGTGGRVVQETLLWDADAGCAYPMRSKEGAHDYRYFPDPDLVPVLVDQAWENAARASLPELPVPRRNRYEASLGLPRYDANVLTAERPVAEYFEQTLTALQALRPGDGAALAKAVSNWVMTDVLRVVAEQKADVASFPVAPGRLAAMIRLILDGTISGKIAKDVFEAMLTSPSDPKAIVQERGLVQVSDGGAIMAIVEEVLAANSAQVQQYISGNERVFGFFVGETMKRMQGKGNPKMVNEVLKAQLAARKG
jgi:aspartyl-tRNA(Asn)/glutamyl-tRNA(Gln) amidotransferase subunit B